MRLLKEIFYDENINLDWKITYRDAVRGIITKKDKLLMIYSPKNGDYKFPGGGVNDGEAFNEALKREILEECGAKVSKIKQEFGKMIEYKIDKYEQDTVFKMTSYYYLCDIFSTKFEEQNLDDYEKDLEFTPVWININDAIKINKNIIASDIVETPNWTYRDTYVLEKIKEEFSRKIL